MITLAEKLVHCKDKQIIIQEVKGDVGMRCQLVEIGHDFISVRFRDGKIMYYNVSNIISIQEVQD